MKESDYSFYSDLVSARIERLPGDLKEEFDSLAAPCGADAKQKAELNMIPFGASGRFAGVFLCIARFNHSCSPNAKFIWNGHQEEVFALRDIEQNEEIFVYYFKVLTSKATRCKSIKTWHDQCMCSTCISGFGGDEDYRVQLEYLERHTFMMMHIGEYGKAMESIESRLHILTTSFSWTLGEELKVKFEGMQALVALGRKEQAQEWAEACLTEASTIYGVDHPQAEKVRSKCSELGLRTLM